MRVALYCSIDPADVEIQYEEHWLDQEKFWKDLKAHPGFRRKKFPDKCDIRAWNHSVHTDFRSGSRAVVLTASMNLNPCKTSPALLLELFPLKLEQSCRLHRRFGSDRFLDLRIPSLDSWSFPRLPKEGLQTAVAHWLTQSSHNFLTRKWEAFWIRSEARRTTTIETQIGPETTSSSYERVTFFATDGKDFSPASAPSLGNDIKPRPKLKCTRDAMLQWLLQFDKNGRQPYLKLFSRLSLGK